ncbi:MAG: glycosyltransferase [Jatrophihabitans sp.]|uniref:glycosyltransferase n=1 Tax=Jatrophihabitans sp. TaxID=1932789 RepID=UPI003F819DF2
MRVLVDAVAALEGSHSIIVRNVLRVWHEVGADDEVHLLIGPDTTLEVPDGVVVHRLPLDRPPGAPAILRRVVAQTFETQRIARQVRAEVLWCTVAASAMKDIGIPRVVSLLDLRHEVRPHQFSRAQRVQRAVSWGYNLRRAAAILPISASTRDDLRRLHPRLAATPAPVWHLGADHVDDWPAPQPEPGARPYALAFGHFPNKNVDEVVEAWAELARRRDGDVPQLTISGLPGAGKTRVAELAARLGVADDVRPLPWVEDDEFRRIFAGAALIVFPSDFEGFGLPAVEAMRLGVPLVVSSDPALVEVTGGHAAVAPTTAAADVATAVEQALARPPEQLDAARVFAARYTWTRTAGVLRDALVTAAATGRAR